MPTRRSSSSSLTHSEFWECIRWHVNAAECGPSPWALAVLCMSWSPHHPHCLSAGVHSAMMVGTCSHATAPACAPFT